MKNELSVGDHIRCRDKEDAGNIADTLCDLGYKWEFCFEHNGKKGIWIEILGRYVDDKK